VDPNKIRKSKTQCQNNEPISYNLCNRVILQEVFIKCIVLIIDLVKNITIKRRNKQKRNNRTKEQAHHDTDCHTFQYFAPPLRYIRVLVLKRWCV
jgi:hypothetical protein